MANDTKHIGVPRECGDARLQEHPGVEYHADLLKLHAIFCWLSVLNTTLRHNCDCRSLDFTYF